MIYSVYSLKTRQTKGEHQMSKLKEPFRYDYVGSFLRTEELKKATTQYKESKITKEVYDNIVNEEIAKLVAKQKELGYHVITDGEFRRTYWHLDLCGDLKA